MSYNPLRQLMEVQDWIGLTKIQNDALGRAVKVTYPDKKEVAYTYGKAGERRSMSYPDGRTVYYGYDEQVRLSELKEGDSIITYGYDSFGRLKEKNFPNGMKTTDAYDEKSQLRELLHTDKEGILDRYTYTYDLVGNKTGITKERRGLVEESGTYTYGYDPLDRLESIRKDNVLETQYHYDAFGNRIKKESGEHQTSYRYNALNQLINLTDQSQEGTSRETYLYDRRDNLSKVIRDGTVKNRYVYGALNRLEEAVNVAGETAKYQYHGLGHRVGKQETDNLEPTKRISYLIDLTKEYHNLLEKVEDDTTQTYFWDGNVAAFEEDRKRSYYLQDELGSPLRIEDELGLTRETYGYGAFGEELYSIQGIIQPFGYTGYQRDSIAGTYYAQAREYNAGAGRFTGQDVIAGVMEQPFSMNRYTYCFNMPMILVDLNGAWPKWIKDVGKKWNSLCENASSFWSKYIYGEDVIVTATTGKVGIAGMYSSQTNTYHKGGNIIVGKVKNGKTVGISLNIPSIEFSEDTKIGVPTSLGVDWDGEDVGLELSVGLEAKIKGYGLEGNASASINSFDWISINGEVGGILKNKEHGLGLKAALNPLSTWDGYVFQKNTKNGISSKLETGLYIRALIPEVVIIAIIVLVLRNIFEHRQSDYKKGGQK